MGKRKPTELKELKGTINTTREAGITAPEIPMEDQYFPPVVLKGHALSKWNELEPLLRNAKVLRSTDIAVLASYCLSWEQLVEAQEMINREGTVYMDANDVPKAHPAVGIKDKALKELRAHSALLGLDPSNRSGLDIGDNKNNKTETGFAGLQAVPRRSTGT